MILCWCFYKCHVFCTRSYVDNMYLAVGLLSPWYSHGIQVLTINLPDHFWTIGAINVVNAHFHCASPYANSSARKEMYPSFLVIIIGDCCTYLFLSFQAKQMEWYKNIFWFWWWWKRGKWCWVHGCQDNVWSTEQGFLTSKVQSILIVVGLLNIWVCLFHVHDWLEYVRLAITGYTIYTSLIRRRKKHL